MPSGVRRSMGPNGPSTTPRLTLSEVGQPDRAWTVPGTPTPPMPPSKAGTNEPGSSSAVVLSSSAVGLL